MKEELLEAWRTHQVATDRLLEGLADDQLDWRYAPRVRTIGKVLSHLHQVRLAWLGAGGTVPEGLSRIRKDDATTTDDYRKHLQASANAISIALAGWLEKGKVPGFRKSPEVFLTYLIAHESHHRGHILATLRLKGAPLHQEDIYRLWEWDKM